MYYSPNDVFVAPGSDRSSTGTHYTPTSLTEPIAQYTLEPLVYEGPKEGLPKKDWKLKSAEEILKLRICDPAMGSGAFLVQTCRYMAERLAETWENSENCNSGKLLTTPSAHISEGILSERLIPDERSERISIARRLIADKCLYGVDINPMAVEMAKLSIWLITVDKKRPFTFLDHAFKCGDTLFGITTMEQLEYFSFHPDKVKQLTFGSYNFKNLLDESSKIRIKLVAMPSDTIEDINKKYELNLKAVKNSSQLKNLADLLVSFENDNCNNTEIDLKKFEFIENIISLMENNSNRLPDFANKILDGRNPLHWNLTFPEIMQQGGFDAIIGNPPFLGGQKISGNLGKKYLDWIKKTLFPDKRGSADLCVFFMRRFYDLINFNGLAGFLATDTLVQGVAQVIGTDWLITNNATIFRAKQKQRWPGTANLNFVQIWFSKKKWLGKYFLNGKEVKRISSALKIERSVVGKPYKLEVNKLKSFQGSSARLPFFITTTEAQELIDKDPRNNNVLFPVLRGNDFVSHPNQECSSWIINFFDWPFQTNENYSNSEQCASAYPDCIKILQERLKPEDLIKDSWWIHYRNVMQLYQTINNFPRVLFHAAIAKYVIFEFVPSNVMFAGPNIVFAYEDYNNFAILQSQVHNIWAWEYGSTRGDGLRYTSSAIFDTFPFPTEKLGLKDVGRNFQQFRQQYLKTKNIGLTDTHNKIHNKNCKEGDIKQMRELSIEMDKAVVNAYGWDDLILEYDFRNTEQGFRFSLPESTCNEILDRLLVLNHTRHAEEVSTGKLKVAKQKPNTSPSLSSPEGLFTHDTEQVTA